MRGNQKNKDYELKWSSDFAYAVGLITADGNLSKNGRHIVLVSKDLQQIKNFKKCLNIDNKIGTRKSSYKKDSICYHVQFGNVKMYRELLKIGLMPNKSKKLGELKIPKKYFFDFLRGDFDGDGSCYSYWDKRWHSSFMFYIKFFSASKKHILWLRSEIQNLLDIKGGLDEKNDRRVYQLKYAKRESRILFSKMYYKKNLPCLGRKYKKLKHILKIDDKEINRTLNLNGRVMESVDIYG